MCAYIYICISMLYTFLHSMSLSIIEHILVITWHLISRYYGTQFHNLTYHKSLHILRYISISTSISMSIYAYGYIVIHTTLSLCILCSCIYWYISFLSLYTFTISIYTGIYHTCTITPSWWHIMVEWWYTDRLYIY